MSECVVRMEIPKNCWVCPFGLDGYIWNENDARTHHVRFCSRHSDEEYHVLEIDTIDRPWFCDSFICQLPDRHGRLVDAELVKEILKPVDSISHYEPEWTWSELHEINCVAIDNAPTIVPAERSKT